VYPAFPKEAQQSKPVHAREADIQNDQVIGLISENIIGGLTVGQPIHRVAVATQTPQYRIPQIIIVFDKQNTQTTSPFIFAACAEDSPFATI
jgi:hypothetical protein